jgi:hypothetical protein
MRSGFVQESLYQCSHWRAKPAHIGGHLPVAWAGSQFVSTGLATILTSSNGRAWTAQRSGTSQNPYGKPLYGVVWSGSQFVAVGGQGIILTSPDGRAWTAQHSGTSQSLYGVAWAGGSRFVAVGDSGTILTSYLITAYSS